MDRQVKNDQSKMLREVVADKVRRRIIEGSLQPGDRLSERALSAELGLSTTPIKEAFRILQTEGMIVSVPGKALLYLPLTRKMFCS